MLRRSFKIISTVFERFSTRYFEPVHFKKMKNNISLILNINGSGGANTMGLSVPSGMFFGESRQQKTVNPEKCYF